MIMMMIRTNRDPWVNWRLAPRWLTAVALPSKSPSPSNYNTGPIARHAILADFLRLFFLKNALTASSRICFGVAHHCTDESHNQAALTGRSILGGFLQTIFHQFDLQQTWLFSFCKQSCCTRPALQTDCNYSQTKCRCAPPSLQQASSSGLSRWFAKKSAEPWHPLCNM